MFSARQIEKIVDTVGTIPLFIILLMVDLFIPANFASLLIVML